MRENKAASLIAIAALGAGAAMVAVSPLMGDPLSWRSGGLVTAAIGLWGTRVVPESLTAFAFLALAMVFAIAPPEAILSGFRSTAPWLVFAGIVLATAIQQTKLADRIAFGLGRVFLGSYPRLLVGAILVGIMLAFLVPSTFARLSILLPIVAALAERAGLEKGSTGYFGALLAAAFGTWGPGAGILQANLPNLVAVGVGETLFGFKITYGTYLLYMFPTLGFLRAATVLVIVLVLFPARVVPPQSNGDRLPPWTPGQIRLAVVLAVTVAAWSLDAIHHISPAWIGIIAAVVVMLPGIGVVGAEETIRKSDFGFMMYLVMVTGLGPIVAASAIPAGLGRAIESTALLDKGAPFSSFMILNVMFAACGLLVVNAAMPAIFGPLAASLAEPSGLSTLGILLMQVLASVMVFLPFQTPPIMFGVHSGYLRYGDTLRMLLLLAASNLLILMPLTYVWWRWLGIT